MSLCLHHHVLSCGYYTSPGGFTYYLTPLTKAVDYQGTQVGTSYLYRWNFCKNLTLTSSCTNNNAAVTQTSNGGNGFCAYLGINPPTISDHPLEQYGGVSVTYINPGSICSNGQPRLTKIVVSCNPNSEYVFKEIIEGFAGICTYEIFMESVYACPMNSSLLDCVVHPDGQDGLLCGSDGRPNCASIGGCLSRLGAVHSGMTRSTSSLSLESLSLSSSPLPSSQIYVHPGTYVNASNCNLYISAHITISSVGDPGSVIIDCQHQSRHMTITQGSVTISGITFLNGRDTDGAGGGCMKIGNSASVFITNSSFNACISLASGGAVYINTTNTNTQTYTTTIHFTSFEDNSASLGGALYAVDEYLYVNDCNFERNIATSNGGALVLSSATITESLLRSNRAGGSGGAIYILAPQFDSLLLNDVNIDQNTALLQGGGIYLSHSSPQVTSISFYNTTIGRNKALLGSGVFLEFGTQPSLSGSVYAFDLSGSVVAQNILAQGHRGASASAFAVVPGAYVQDFSIQGLVSGNNGEVDVSCSSFYTSRSFSFCSPSPCSIMDDLSMCKSVCANKFSVDGGAPIGSYGTYLCLNGVTKQCGDHGQCFLTKNNDDDDTVQATCTCSHNYKGQDCDVYTCGVGDCLLWIPISLAILIVLLIIAIVSMKLYRRKRYESIPENPMENR
eukprot:TRINITY_DN4804_c1_g1_i2.p1 TRINITY_DN4804_c1_g1~~TRINITY_DN4804_c1_g1_i2.p1  ORF type:complete len:695 (-),score=60.43 TRINITY_DN4804_c1_g1_i2:321-2345(-)